MYNILLVDDDEFFSSMFITGYDWQAASFCMAARAESGQRAIELLYRENIDLAFVDMCMPGMNGPELIAYIHRHFPRISCVALSNHDDFDFVKESFRAGADDYVLKHCLSRHEMRRILNAYLERRGASDERVAEPPQQGNEPENDSASNYLMMLLRGRIAQSGDDYCLSDALKLPRFKENILLVRTDIADYEQFRQKYFRLSRLQYILRSVTSILRSVQERHAEGVVFFSAEDKCFYTLMTDPRFSSLDFLTNTRELYIQQVSNSLNMYFNVTCVTTPAPLAADIRDISRAYAFVGRENGGEGSPREHTLDTEAICQNAISAMSRSLAAPDFEDARRYLARLYEDGRRLEYTQDNFLQLSITLYRVFLLCRKNLTDAPMDSREGVARLFGKKNVREMETTVQGAFAGLYDAFNENRDSQHSGYIRSALDIIRRQYALPSLSLGVIAEMINVSDSYLSRIFKLAMGVGISEYINRFRIERAQALFTIDRVSVKNVALRCGFDNYTYFFRIFKKYTGLTPKEFCEKHRLYLPDAADERERPDD